MSGSITVIIADSNTGYVEGLRAEMMKHDMDVIAETNDGLELLDLIQNGKPVCVIMELILRNLDGIEVLNNLNENGVFMAENAPKIIVNSSLDNQTVVNKSISLGAKYFFRKPTLYNEIAKRARMLCGQPSSLKLEYYLEADHTKREHEISMQLKRIGVPVHLMGYRYLMAAIGAVCSDLGSIEEITNTIYPDIASEYSTTPIRVERSIRYAIEAAFETGSMHEIDNLFGYTVNSLKGKPTNSEFIAMVADSIMMR